MKSEQVKGVSEQAAGRAQDIFGDLTGDERLQLEGKARKLRANCNSSKAICWMRQWPSLNAAQVSFWPLLQGWRCWPGCWCVAAVKAPNGVVRFGLALGGCSQNKVICLSFACTAFHHAKNRTSTRNRCGAYPLLARLAHAQPYSSQAELAQAFHAETGITAHPDTFAKALSLIPWICSWQ